MGANSSLCICCPSQPFTTKEMQPVVEYAFIYYISYPHASLASSNFKFSINPLLVTWAEQFCKLVVPDFLTFRNNLVQSGPWDRFPKGLKWKVGGVLTTITGIETRPLSSVTPQRHCAQAPWSLHAWLWSGQWEIAPDCWCAWLSSPATASGASWCGLSKAQHLARHTPGSNSQLARSGSSLRLQQPPLDLAALLACRCFWATQIAARSNT